MLSLGAPFHASNFAKNSNGKDPNYAFRFLPYDPKTGYGYLNWRSVDVLWNYGFFFNAWHLLQLLKSSNHKMKVVNFWAGSDILEVEQTLTKHPQLRDIIFRNVDVHATDSQGFRREVKEKFGIESLYVPSIPPKPMLPAPLPRRFTVAVYMPRERLSFFQYPIVEQAAKAYRRTPFYLFPSHKIISGEQLTLGSVARNMHFMDFVEGDEKAKWWSKCSVLIVLPVHGSVSITGMEFMQMGRTVITTQPGPFMVEAHSAPEVITALADSTKLGDYAKAQQFYAQEYTAEKQFEYTVNLLRNI